MNRITASKAPLLEFCQAFPNYEWDPRSGPYADRGTRFHKAAASYVETGLRPDVEADILSETQHACDWIDALGVPLSVLAAEAAFAWDPETDVGEVIGVERDYSKAGDRFCGTADLVLVSVADKKPIAVTVWDYKTGSAANAGPQLRALGLMAARAYGVDHVTVAALEVSRGGVLEVGREDLGPFELAAIAGELAEKLVAVRTAQPTPGSHCGELYCPARLSCPLGTAATGDLVEVIPAEALTRPREYRLTDPIETAEHAMWAIDVLRLVNAKLDAIKDDIKAKVPDGGWAAADGRVLREAQATIETLDKNRAIALCKELGATDEQLGGLYYTFTKSNGLRVSGGTTKARPRRKKEVAA